MLKNRNAKSLAVSSLIIVLICIIFSSSMVAGQVDLSSVIKEKLAEVSDEEKKVLEELFLLVQEIEKIEKDEAEFIKQIEIIDGEIKDLEMMISNEEEIYNEKRDVLKQVLKSYQRTGPGSYLEIILNSDSLSTFLRKINTFRDLTRNTGDLLESMENSKEKLLVEKKKLSDNPLLINEKREELKQTLDDKIMTKKSMEEILDSLKEQKEYYKEHMANIQQLWGELKPFITETTREFSRVIEDGNLPQDAIETTFSLFRIKGVLKEETFNDILSSNTKLPEMEFSFEPGKMTMNIPEENLVLSGSFVILDDQVLKFQVEEGSFYGMELEAASIEELFKEGYMVLNLKPLLGKSILNSVEIKKDNIELIITPNLF